MSFVIYLCENFGEIKELSPKEYALPFTTSQFCIVKKYDHLYEKELPRFVKHEETPYALPAKNKIMHIYNGIDREPLKYTPDDFHEYTESAAIQYFNSLSKQETELIFIRITGCGDSLPDSFSFLGYDVAWLFGYGDCDGFSAICDCMFLSRWHGCDDERTEFKEEFQWLNNNGLFNNVDDARNYLIHYLNQDWSELGDYCIYEIYGYF